VLHRKDAFHSIVELRDKGSVDLCAVPFTTFHSIVELHRYEVSQVESQYLALPFYSRIAVSTSSGIPRISLVVSFHSIVELLRLQRRRDSHTGEALPFYSRIAKASLISLFLRIFLDPSIL